MLTSSVVNVDMKLPVSDSKTIAPTDLAVMLYKNGKIKVNGKNTSKKNLEIRIADEMHYLGNSENGTISIISELGTPWQNVHMVMKVASGLKLRAIIATAPTS